MTIALSKFVVMCRFCCVLIYYVIFSLQDRPSLVIYQPGMGKFSKQRLAKEKESQLPTAKSVNESEKKDT